MDAANIAPQATAVAVDLTPIIQALVGLAALVVTSIGGLVLKKLATWLGLKQEDQRLQNFDTALQRAVQAGAMQVTGMIAQKGWDHPDVHSAIVARGLDYVTLKFPNILKSAGLDPTDPATAGKIEDALLRVLPTALKPVAESPATPPVPPQQREVTVNA